MKTILAAIDFSKISDAVVAEAVDLARAVKGRLVVVTVMQRVVVVPPVNSGGYVSTMKAEEITAAAEKATVKRLAKVQARLQAARIGNEGVLLTGLPADQILARAKKHTADYIVMGSHGHTAVYELLVGSTTHGVLLRAQCPVVIVPAKRKPRRGTKPNRSKSTPATARASHAR